MHWLTYIIPKLIYKVSSPYNHDIRVVEEGGKYKILVNGSRQSGPYVADLWNYAAKSFKVSELHPPKNILVFGVAGGTVIHMLSDWFPEAKITGVDIDPVMIEIGNAYFGLRDIHGFSARVADAKTFVKQAPSKKYDLVVVDIFFGRNIPHFLTTKEFLKDLARIISPKGKLWINYLREKEYEPKAGVLHKTLSGIYNHVESVNYFNNRFFFAWI